MRTRSSLAPPFACVASFRHVACGKTATVALWLRRPPRQRGGRGFDPWPSHMLPHSTDISLYALIYIVVLTCNFFCPFFFIILLIWYGNARRQTETVNGTSISKLDLPFFTRAIPKGLSFELFVYVIRSCNVHVLYCIHFVGDLNL